MVIFFLQASWIELRYIDTTRPEYKRPYAAYISKVFFKTNISFVRFKIHGSVFSNGAIDNKSLVQLINGFV